jgi:hypothetical protein
VDEIQEDVDEIQEDIEELKEKFSIGLPSILIQKFIST